MPIRLTSPYIGGRSGSRTQWGWDHHPLQLSRLLHYRPAHLPISYSNNFVTIKSLPGYRTATFAPSKYILPLSIRVTSLILRLADRPETSAFATLSPTLNSSPRMSSRLVLIQSPCITILTFLLLFWYPRSESNRQTTSLTSEASRFTCLRTWALYLVREERLELSIPKALAS